MNIPIKNNSLTSLKLPEECSKGINTRSNALWYFSCIKVLKKNDHSDISTDTQNACIDAQGAWIYPILNFAIVASGVSDTEREPGGGGHGSHIFQTKCKKNTHTQPLDKDIIEWGGYIVWSVLPPPPLLGSTNSSPLTIRLVSKFPILWAR